MPARSSTARRARASAPRSVSRCVRVVLVTGTALALARPASAQLLINDVRPWFGSTGVEAMYPSQVTLHNAGPSTEFLSSYAIRAHADTAIYFALPADSSVPPGGYFVVNFGPAPAEDVGIDAPMWSPPTTAGVLGKDWGEVGLYSGGAIMDFVAWGSDTTTMAASYTDAVGAGQWTAGTYVNTRDYSVFAHISRVPTGYDTDARTDWLPGERYWGFPVEAHSDVQVSPPSGTVYLSLDTLLWRDVPDASAYHVQVATDASFAGLVVDSVVADTRLSPLSLPPDSVSFYWRVMPVLAGGPYPASVWRFYIGGITGTAAGATSGVSAAAAAGNKPQINVKRRVQHKDTHMLCLWDLGVAQNTAFWRQAAGEDVLRRWGCFTVKRGRETSYPWKAKHSTAEKHINTCWHCALYCVRASFQMANRQYNGTITQDEISYKLKRHATPGPEGDLGHRTGETNPDSLLAGLRWVMNGNNGVSRHKAVDGSFATLDAEIQAGRLVIAAFTGRSGRAGTESHMMVLAGWGRVNNIPVYYVVDPQRAARTKWYLYTDLRADFFFTLPAGATGRAGNALISTYVDSTDTDKPTDSDDDGVVDFDEGLKANGQMDPGRRNLQSRPDTDDTDGDGIKDRIDIASYTFHHYFHPNHPKVGGRPASEQLTFPDGDGDNRRAENDSDSDGDGHADGVEDCNKNGVSPQVPPDPPCEGGVPEYCTYDPNSHPMPVATRLTSFRIEAREDRIAIHWTTSSEENVLRFEIDRDGVPAGTVEASGGPGGGAYVWEDAHVDDEGSEREYRLFEVDGSGERVLLASDRVTPPGAVTAWALHPAYPNPFNPTTAIRYDVLHPGRVTITLYDAAGRRVRTLLDRRVGAGRRAVTLRARDLASGVYFVRMRAQGFANSRKVVVLK